MEEKDLQIFLNEHFCYEVEMLYFTAVSIKYYIIAGSQRELNMSLECFLSHGRNLLEFFYYKPADNYARATHFIESDKWQQVKPEKTKNITELERRASPEVAHLTFDRISGTPPEKLWDCSNCFYDLLEVTKKFINLLPNQFHGSGIIDLKNNIDKLKL
jgi:hypothetical protein